MLNFTGLVESILSDTELLNEMPALTPSLQVWIDKCVEEIVGQRGSGSVRDKVFTTYTKTTGDYGGVHKSNRYFFDKLSIAIEADLYKGVNKLNVLKSNINCKDFCTTESLSDLIANTKCLVSANDIAKLQIIHSIQDICEDVCREGDVTVNNVTLKRILNYNVFVAQVVTDVLTILFSRLFTENKEKKFYTNKYSEFNKRGDQVDWDYINSSTSEVEFKEHILMYLPDIFDEVYKKYGMEYIPNKIIEDQTAQMISQSRGAFISDWETKLKDYRREL